MKVFLENQLIVVD